MVESNQQEGDFVDPVNKSWGFEYMYSSFLDWSESLSKQQFLRNSLLVAVGSIVLIGLATWLDFNSTIQALIAFPAAISLFGFLLATVHRRHDPERPTLRERFSAAQRRRIVYVVSAVYIVFFIFLSTRIPYALGGTLFIVGALSLYNLARRTPVEVALDRAGILDPRDVPDEEENGLDEYLESEEDEGWLSPDEGNPASGHYADEDDERSTNS